MKKKYPSDWFNDEQHQQMLTKGHLIARGNFKSIVELQKYWANLIMAYPLKSNFGFIDEQDVEDGVFGALASIYDEGKKYPLFVISKSDPTHFTLNGSEWFYIDYKSYKRNN